MKYKNPEMEIVVFGQDVLTDLTYSPNYVEGTDTSTGEGTKVPGGEW